jgi:hypothetical protein
LFKGDNLTLFAKLTGDALDLVEARLNTRGTAP